MAKQRLKFDVQTTDLLFVSGRLSAGKQMLEQALQRAGARSWEVLAANSTPNMFEMIIIIEKGD